MKGIARQQRRAWIETELSDLPLGEKAKASPASNGGRGLKLIVASLTAMFIGIARQQRRAWIETPTTRQYQQT